jgi:predicted PurR-regulated permease PerM
MEFFLPSLFVMLLAMVVVFIFLPRFSPLILAIMAAVLLALAGWQHYQMFRSEYGVATWIDSAKKFAPVVLVGFVVIVIIGYLLLIFTSGKGQMSGPPGSIPPPASATNSLTRSIGQGLSAMGMPVSKNGSATPPNSASNWISGNNNVGNTQRRNIAARGV